MMRKFPTEKIKIDLYNKYAKFYEQRTKNFDRFIRSDLNLFLENLAGKNILDLGSGPGRDSLFFKKEGFNPLCLDISEEMLKICRQKSLRTLQMNMENLKLPQNSFDGVWSYTSLTTIPKQKVWRIIKKIHKILKNEGVLFLGLIEGKGEKWKNPDKKYDLPRFVSRYTTQEILQNIKKFELLYFRKIPQKVTGRNTYLNFMFRKIN